MLSDFHKARDYLAPAPESFWRWQDDGDVIVLLDGTTLLFRAELRTILQGLEQTGLPNFTQLLLLLAACRDNWPVIRSQFARILLETVTLKMSQDTLSTSPSELVPPRKLRSRLDHLDGVHALASDVRSTVAAKIALAKYTFETTNPVIPPGDVTDIVRALDAGIPMEFLQQRGEPMTLLGFVRNLAALHTPLLGVSDEILRLRNKTGLDELVRAAPVDIKPSEQIRQLLNDVLDDPELAGMARVARQLMATIHLPRALIDQDDAALGGISDISNRGPLDRLLLSELANDDLTLTVRVAMNEALYLRREAPPRPPAQSRSVFIDTGIRMWGTPRVFATAVALSLAATTDQLTEVAAFREERRGVVRVDLTTREGLIAQLAALAGSVHPGAVIDAFFRAAQREGDDGDLVLITGEDVLADPEFLQKLAACQLPSTLYLAIVNREGRFQLLTRSSRGTKLLREAKLDLDTLLAPQLSNKPSRPLYSKDTQNELPVILSQTPFPLALPVHLDARRTWTVQPQAAVSITNDQRIMYWSRMDRGGIQLSDTVPRGKLHWCDYDDIGVARAIVGSLARNCLWLIRCEYAAGKVETVRLETSVSPILGLTVHDGVLFVITYRQVEFVDLTTGKIQNKIALPSTAKWMGSRFFTIDGGWFALHFNGLTAATEKLADGPPGPDRIVTMFQCAGREGYVGVTHFGNLFFTANHEFRNTSPKGVLPKRVRAVARDGSCVIVSLMADPSKIWRINVPDGMVTPVFGDVHLAAQPALRAMSVQKNLRNRFLAVAATADGSLALVSRHGVPVPIEFQLSNGSLRFSAARTQAGNLRGRMPFSSIDGPPGTGYQLQRAEWKDGSRAFLDSRGLLHLVSARSEVPQLTLALSDTTPFAGWASNGWTFGPEYFTCGRRNATAEQINQLILREFVKWLP